MDNTSQDQNITRKSTYADRLQKEIDSRKSVTGLAAVLSKFNPFAVATASK